MIKKFKLFEYISHYSSKNGDFSLSRKLGISNNDSEKIYRSVADFYSQKPEISFLGSGSYGSAFTLDDKVLKLTTDPNEIRNIEYLRKKNFAGIVSYYDLRKINLFIDNKLSNIVELYSIIMDRVEPLDSVELECYNMLYRFGYKNLRFDYNIDYLDINEKSAKRFKIINDGSILKTILNCIKISNNQIDFSHNLEEMLDAYYDFEFIHFKDLKKSKNIEEILTKFYFDIRDIIADVIKHKLSLHDSHYKNVGKDKDGHFKMIDLGFRSNRPSKIKLKLQPIEIKIDIEKFILLQSEDSINFNYEGEYDSIEDAISNIPGNVNEKWVTINGESFLIYYTRNNDIILYYRILSSVENEEDFSRGVWKLKDPNQLTLKFPEYSD